MAEIRKQGAVDVVNRDGPLTHEDVGELSVAFQQCLSSGQPMAVLNMQATQMIDSAGLELLLDTQQQFQARGGALRIATPNRLCDDILRATGVADHVEIFPEVGLAVRSFLQ